MGMPRGLSKATNYYNRLEAWRDWRKLASEVEGAGLIDLVVKYAPPETAGWRKIDKAIADLRDAFQTAQNNQPVWEHGIRCHGYWLGIKQVGFVGLTPPMVKPVMYTWSLNVPYYEAVKGQCLSLRKAKSLVEQAYAQNKGGVKALPC